MNRRLLLSAVFSFSILNGMDMPPMPPMIPMEKSEKIDKAKNNQEKKQTNSIPSSCQLIPPMIIMLPPPMEKELDKCKNEMFMPKKIFVEKQLAKLLKKSVKVKSIEIVPKFNQLYKVTYDGGVILTNKKVDAFIKQ